MDRILFFINSEAKKRALIVAGFYEGQQITAEIKKDISSVRLVEFLHKKLLSYKKNGISVFDKKNKEPVAVMGDEDEEFFYSGDDYKTFKILRKNDQGGFSVLQDNVEKILKTLKKEDSNE